MSHRIQSLLAHCKTKASGAQRARPADGHPHSIMPSPEVRASLQEDGVVFLHLRSGIVFRSNRIGAAIWKGLGSRQELAAIASQIGREYGIPVEQAARDAAGFVAQLEAQGFLVRPAGA
jgi:hypothetical protein